MFRFAVWRALLRFRLWGASFHLSGRGLSTLFSTVGTTLRLGAQLSSFGCASIFWLECFAWALIFLECFLSVFQNANFLWVFRWFWALPILKFPRVFQTECFFSVLYWSTSFSTVYTGVSVFECFVSSLRCFIFSPLASSSFSIFNRFPAFGLCAYFLSLSATF